MTKKVNDISKIYPTDENFNDISAVSFDLHDEIADDELLPVTFEEQNEKVARKGPCQYHKNGISRTELTLLLMLDDMRNNRLVPEDYSSRLNKNICPDCDVTDCIIREHVIEETFDENGQYNYENDYLMIGLLRRYLKINKPEDNECKTTNKKL